MMTTRTDEGLENARPAFALIAESHRLIRQSDELLKLMASFDEAMDQTTTAADGLLNAEPSALVSRFAN